jgi:hypothetical protein
VTETFNRFQPYRDITNAGLILVEGEWPNFHDAEVHHLNVWRGDVRPDDNVWTGPQVVAQFELCALQYPFIAELTFFDCEAIRLDAFNHQNALYDLSFELIPRGFLRNGNPLPPFIQVAFQQAFGMELSFRCMRIAVTGRREVDAND